MSEDSFRVDYPTACALLEKRIAEEAPGRIQLLTGPRQVGKTTLLLKFAAQWGERAIYAAGDEPAASLAGFWDQLWRRAEELSSVHGTVLLLLDEIQHIADWSARLKTQWDRVRRRRLPIHVIATGSSALRIGAGSRESLAGRFERISLSHWSAAALVETFGLTPEESVRHVVRMGSYPGSVPLRSDLPRWTAYVRDAIVEPAMTKDILALAEVRRPALLRQVMAICAGSPAQILSLQKIQGRLQDAGALETILHYLQILEEAYLVAALEKHSPRAVRRRAAPPKLVTLNNAILAALDPRGIPDPAREPDRFGAWVENACLAYAWNSGQRVTYWREEPFEVDGVLEGSWGRWAVEVKTGPFGALDMRGLSEFTSRYRDYRPLVLCDPGQEKNGERIGASAMAWDRFLLGTLTSART